jgi:D-serine deaminase-like pyridoxal phosphate-dependent protein
VYVQPVGTPKFELDTPALIVDLDVVDRNIAMMAEFLKGTGVSIRPHMKVHTTPYFAHKQLAAGAIGVTFAKLSQAEVMAAAGITDILLAYQVIGPVKINRLMSLARSTDILVAVDDAENVRQLEAAAGQWGVKPRVLIEVDIGQHRCGVPRGEQPIALASQVAESKHLRLAGVMGYEGHAGSIQDDAARAATARAAIEMLTGVAEDCRQQGMEIGIISAGGTGTYATTGAYPGVTEIQPGSYVTMDGRYKRLGVPFECALTVLTTVVSRQRSNVLITDCGMKQMSSDMGMPLVTNLPGAKVARLSVEHGIVELDDPGVDVKVGDVLELLPMHGDTTINLHDDFFCVRDGKLESVVPIAARGKSR